jgi:hypothetical protein
MTSLSMPFPAMHFEMAARAAPNHTALLALDIEQVCRFLL